MFIVWRIHKLAEHVGWKVYEYIYRELLVAVIPWYHVIFVSGNIFSDVFKSMCIVIWWLKILFCWFNCCLVLCFALHADKIEDTKKYILFVMQQNYWIVACIWQGSICCLASVSCRQTSAGQRTDVQPFSTPDRLFGGGGFSPFLGFDPFCGNTG